MEDFKRCAAARADMRRRFDLAAVEYGQRMSLAEIRGLRRYISEYIHGNFRREPSQLLRHAVLRAIQDGVLCRFPQPTELADLLHAMGAATHVPIIFRCSVLLGPTELAGAALAERTDMTQELPAPAATAARILRAHHHTRKAPMSIHGREMSTRYSGFIGEQGENFRQLTEGLGLLYMWLSPVPEDDVHRTLLVYSATNITQRDLQVMKQLRAAALAHRLDFASPVRYDPLHLQDQLTWEGAALPESTRDDDRQPTRSQKKTPSAAPPGSARGTGRTSARAMPLDST